MGYLTNITNGLSTIFEGLAITASHLLRRPITVQYPDRIPEPLTDTLPPRYRGFLKTDMNICTGCTLCQGACPIQCIEIGIAKTAPSPQPSPLMGGGDAILPVPLTGEGKGGGAPARVIDKFNIDIGKCMFCGLCTEVCPTGAIHFTREFEGSTPDLNELVFKFVEEGKFVVPYKKG
jgi:formate hydrogenlyase subunit 6/NADH:ubiquinone oxidoreductase subunit I